MSAMKPNTWYLALAPLVSLPRGAIEADSWTYIRPQESGFDAHRQAGEADRSGRGGSPGRPSRAGERSERKKSFQADDSIRFPAGAVTSRPRA